MIMNLRNEGIYDPDMDHKGNRECERVKTREQEFVKAFTEMQ